MIFNHPSAYIYSNPQPLSNPSRNSQIISAPSPLIGASEGSTWSPCLKSQSILSPIPTRSNDQLNRTSGGIPISQIPRSRSRNAYSRAPGRGSIVSEQISPMLSSSPCFSLSVPSEDEDDHISMSDQAGYEHENRASLIEPPSPIPRLTRIKSTFSP